MKKIKVQKNKFRSRTSQKSNNLKTLDLNLDNQSKIKDPNKNINNESNKSLIKIRAKTEGKNNARILNSEKKTTKNKNNISIKVDNNILNNTLKLNKTHSSKFTLSEQSYKKTKKKLNLENNNNNNGETNKINNNTNNKERKNSKDIKSISRKNTSKNKLNTLQKSQNNLKSKSNLLSDSKEKLDEEKNISKKLLSNKKNPKIDYRQSFDHSNKKIPKPKINNYVKKNTEILSEKRTSSKKKFLGKKKSKNNLNENKKEENVKTEEDTDTIIKRFEKQKEILEKIRKQREENNLRDEEKKKEIEKEKEEEKKREEERKKRDLEIKRREEQRKKELEEEERKRDEERKKRQMEIEAKIEKEKIEKENMKKELELEKRREIERQKKLEEERIKKEEMEKLELEMDKLKLKEEEVKELPNSIELNLEKNENNEIENKNKEMNIQDLLELEEKNDQNFEYFHIKEEIDKDSLLVTPEEKKINKTELKNDTNNDNNNLNKNIMNNLEEKLCRNISILELIHDVPKFSPILFEFLSFEETMEFTSISKKIKRQRIYIFNLQKINIIKNIGLDTEQNLEKKIKEYEENYSNNELNEPFIEFHLSRGAARAIQLLNNNNYSKIFRRPVLDNNLSQIYIAYRILFIFLNEVDIAKISDDKLFWIKCTEYLNSKSENGKIGDFIMSKFENYNCDCKTVYYIEQILKGKKDNISPSHFSKICGSTGLLIFLIKELMEYCGVIISTKKTQLSRIYKNLNFFKNIVDMLSEFNKTLENFNY